MFPCYNMFLRWYPESKEMARVNHILSLSTLCLTCIATTSVLWNLKQGNANNKRFGASHKIG